MLYFITGKPGNGKTLYTIATVRKLAKETGRPVYYNGINLSEKGKRELGWIEFPVDKIQTWEKLDNENYRIWPHIPDGAIVVLDEVQRFWRARKQGSHVPETVQAMENHRHFGFDFFFVTQDPTLVDQNVRKLVWEHTHIKRIFGTENATLYRWKQKVASVNSEKEYEEGVLSETWGYPKDVYELYKSAEVHTAGKQLPWRQITIIGVLSSFFFGGLVWVWNSFGDDAKKLETENTAAQAGEGPHSAAGGPARRIRPTHVWDPEYRQARLDGLPNSAKLYDELQEVVSQPRIAGCYSMKINEEIECNCITAQRTRIEMSIRQCLQFMKHGWFDPTRPEIDSRAENIAYLNSRDSMGASPGGEHATDVKKEKPSAFN